MEIASPGLSDSVLRNGLFLIGFEVYLNSLKLPCGSGLLTRASKMSLNSTGGKKIVFQMPSTCESYSCRHNTTVDEHWWTTNECFGAVGRWLEKSFVSTLPATRATIMKASKVLESFTDRSIWPLFLLVDQKKFCFKLSNSNIEFISINRSIRTKLFAKISACESERSRQNPSGYRFQV